MVTEILLKPERVAELAGLFQSWPSLSLTPRQLCDLEMILNGGFAPLSGFMCQEDYESSLEHMRLSDGTLWPIPILLDVTETIARELAPGSSLVLQDIEGVPLAVLHVQDVWQPDLHREARTIYGTTSVSHPGVRRLMEGADRWIVGGSLEGIRLPQHYDFVNLHHTPADIRREAARRDWNAVIAFPTRRLINPAEYGMTRRIIAKVGGGLLLHPVVETAYPADFDYYMRVRCYQYVVKRYPGNEAMLSLLTLATRMAGSREMIWRAIIEKNHGCTHLIVDDDDPTTGIEPGYTHDTGETRNLLVRHAEEIGVALLQTRHHGYESNSKTYVPVGEIATGGNMRTCSDAEFQTHFAEGDDIPDGFMFPEVAEELRRRYPPKVRMGFTVFFTGLSGSGKSTIANIVRIRLLERGGRRVTLLDGDLVRKLLSSELGFSRAHRDINIRRIGFVASEITKNGGVAICAPIAPYDAIRREIRIAIEAVGGFVLVFVDTPIEVCEKRDRKGLYAKARAGLLPGFTGISDPYEPPQDAEVVVRTTEISADEGATRIIEYLERAGYLVQPDTANEPRYPDESNTASTSRKQEPDR